jgi:hypothetical protein
MLLLADAMAALAEGMAPDSLQTGRLLLRGDHQIVNGASDRASPRLLATLTMAFD